MCAGRSTLQPRWSAGGLRAGRGSGAARRPHRPAAPPVRVVVEGGGRFAAIDPERWAVERRYRDADPRTALTTFGERRAASLAFLAGVPPEVLRHAVTHPRLGTLSGLDLLAAWVTHDRLHLAQLAATLARLGARRWTPLRHAHAGPIHHRESPSHQRH